MLGLIDSAALARSRSRRLFYPSLARGTHWPGALAGVGFAAAALVFALPRIARRRQLLRFRFGRWLSPRTTSLRDASAAWALVSACWLARAGGLVVLLGALAQADSDFELFCEVFTEALA
jgi:hypothetical protein